MKIILLSAFVFLTFANVFAASPTFQTFDPNSFTVNQSANSIAINSAVTNGFVTAAITNGLATTNDYVRRYDNRGQTNSSIAVTNSAYQGTIGIQNTAAESAGQSAIDSFQGFRLFPSTGNFFQLFFGGFAAGSRFIDNLGTTSGSAEPIADDKRNALRWNGWANSTLFRTDGIKVGFLQTPWSSAFWYGGGSSAGNEDMPAQSMLADAMPVAPIVITAFDNQSGWYYSNTNETQMTNLVYQVYTSGFITNVLNGGGQVYFRMEDNTMRYYLNPTRDASGFLTINTNAFPDGTNFASIVHSMGGLIGGQLYWWPYPTNLALVYYQGAISTNYGAPPAMSPVYPALDISKFYDFGWDFFRLADVSAGDTGNWLQSARMVMEDDLLPYDSSPGSPEKRPFNNTIAGVGKNRNVPLAFEMLTRSSGDTPPQVYDNANTLGYDQGNQSWPGYIASSDPYFQAANTMRCFYYAEASHIKRGQYSSGTYWQGQDNLDNATRLNLAWSAVLGSEIQIGYNQSHGNFGAQYPLLTTFATNTLYEKILFEKNRQRGWMVYDNSQTNTSEWYCQLSGGAYAVLLQNGTNTSQSFTINLSDLKADPSKTYFATEVWSNGLGSALGTGTISKTVLATNCALIYLSPTNDYSGTITLTPFATTNPVITFSGVAAQYVVTNAANFAPTFAGRNGSIDILFTNGGNTVLGGQLLANPAVYWGALSFSNNIATNNACLLLTSFGTNHIVAQLFQP